MYSQDTELGEFVRALRIEQQLTQVQLAQRLRVSQKKVCFVEQGKTRLSLLEFVAWCEALKLPPGSTLERWQRVTQARQRQRGLCALVREGE
jgi:transcriptional regulator with XRE-family HTH domain